MVAAAGAAENQPGRLLEHGTMALARVTKATSVGWRRRSRERERKKISGEGEQQQKFGGQTLHAFQMERNPRVAKA
jgi:hypothetical protein